MINDSLKIERRRVLTLLWARLGSRLFTIFNSFRLFRVTRFQMMFSTFLNFFIRFRETCERGRTRSVLLVIGTTALYARLAHIASKMAR